MEREKLDQVITFEPNSDEITPAARIILEEIARYLAQPEQENVYRLELEVSSESVGSKVYNDNLSINRSIAAQKILKQKLALLRRKGIYFITSISANECNEFNLSPPKIVFCCIKENYPQLFDKCEHICSFMLRHGWTAENLPLAYPQELKWLLQYVLSESQPFEITDENWDNLTLIEALVEFYMNYTNPWGTGEVVGETVPRLPTMEGYISVDLSTDWHLVLIDPCDGRLRGNKALVSDDKEDDENVIKIEDENVNLSKINPNFDTIYLASGKKKIFRITGVNQDERKLTLDSKIVLNSEVSPWHIPAGFSRELDGMDLNYNLGPGGDQGWDHYDGMMLIIKDGQVHAKYPWSSYTSRIERDEEDKNDRASLKGNMKYHFKSCRAYTSAYINYAFWVRLFDSTEAEADPEKCFYFDLNNNEVLREDDIMIHKGVDDDPDGGTGSAGCLVSLHFYTFRRKMIALYLGDGNNEGNNGNIYLLHNIPEGCNDPEQYFENVSSGYWINDTILEEYWYNKIKGTFWLVRPEQPSCS